MSSHSRTHDRSRSRTDAFLDALESGQVREAIGTLKPTSHSHDGHRHHHHHHDSRAHDHYSEGAPHHRRSRYDDYYPPEDGLYYDEVARPRRHLSAHSDRHYDDRRGRSSGGGGHNHGHSSHHHHHHNHNHRKRPSSSHGPDLKQAAGAAVAAGVVEAFRSRHDPDRTARVATAAIGAAATDSALGSGRHGYEKKKEKRHVVESALAGLVENRVINGPRR
ncbi:hypothetical protein F4859DRAFT_513137 [Xylaria cf. heliscus]|nr:hypothetical protein F4859DRAFT_513137 [Xylaria cf. heliscus]